MNKRYHTIDFIRGLAIINMVIYHLLWDLAYIFNYNYLTWFDSNICYAWQQLICWTFILVSGFCFDFSHNKLKKGLLIFCFGWLVTAVTMFAIPSEGIIFGILTLIGSCTLIMIPLQKHLDKSNTVLAITFFIILFILCKNINRGYIGFSDLRLITLPKSLYANMFTAYLGFPFKGFSSSDYFSLIPWLFLYIVGYLLFLLFKKYNLMPKLEGHRFKLIEFIGRHSLLIYILHQPIIIFILMAL